MNETYSVSGTVLLILLALAGGLLLAQIHKVMNDRSNDLEWSQFISSRGLDGREQADVDKLGKVVGIFVGSWAVILVCLNTKLDGMSAVAFFTAYLTYVGGVAAYSALLRSRRGSVTESTTLETSTGTTSQSQTKEKTTTGS